MKTIILNKMYTGNYLETGGNISHEVINLFKSDNGNNYIYLLSDGVMPTERNGTIDAILLVRWIRLGRYGNEISAYRMEDRERPVASPEKVYRSCNTYLLRG